MKILLSGYGTMGRVVEDLALEKGHEIAGVFSIMKIDNSPYPVYDDVDSLPEADVIIDFSHPSNVSKLLLSADVHKLPIVVATTGERESLQELMNTSSKFAPVFFSANMSYGVHVFTELLKFVTPLLSSSFDIEIIEKHHNKKVDAPSGTAIKLLEAIQSVNPEYFSIFDRSIGEHKRDKKEIGMSAIRGGTIVGEHDVIFAGTDEVIEIKHSAQSKRIFADGAIKAAEKISTLEPGFYDFHTI